MNTYSFTILVKDAHSVVKNLSSVGCDDALIDTFSNVTHIIFNRQADTLMSAVDHAIEQVISADIGTISDIKTQ